jgi:hypothetical protein
LSRFGHAFAGAPMDRQHIPLDLTHLGIVGFLGFQCFPFTLKFQ